MKIFNIINKNLHFSINFHLSKNVAESRVLPIITISREQGAGGIIIAKKLAKKLGKKWEYYHKDIVDKIAEEAKTSVGKVQEIEEKPVPAFQDFIEGFFSSGGLDLSKYYKNLIKVLLEVGNNGNAIIVGRGANFLFPNALKVRIIADRDQRIKWLMQYEKLSENEAILEADETDKERSKFISNLYNRNITDPYNYDLIIKTSLSLPAEEAADIIARVAKKRFKL